MIDSVPISLRNGSDTIDTISGSAERSGPSVPAMTIPFTRILVLTAAVALGASSITGCSATSQPPGAVDAVSPADGARADDAAVFGGPSAVTEAGVADAPVDREVVTTGVVTMTVDDPAGVADQVIALVEGIGGRIDARSSRSRDEDPDNDEHEAPANASVTARIPADALSTVIDQLGELGAVESVKLQSQDVTAEAIDLDARISTLRTSISRLTTWLGESENVDDLIRLERTLQQRQADLERLTAERARLTDQVAYSTVVIRLSTVPTIQEGPDDFWSALVVGW